MVTTTLNKSILLLILLCIASMAKGEFVIVVNPDNPIEELSTREVKKIFLGKLRLFPRTNIPVQVIDQDDGVEIRELFYSNFIRMNGPRLFRYRASYLFSGLGTAPQRCANGEAVKRAVSENESAVGYIHKSQVDESVKVVFQYFD